MSAIKNINANEGHRDIVASDRTLAYTDGYKNLFTNATTPSVADIVTAGGVVELSNVYTLGTFNLFVYVNGQLLVRPGDDYGETDNRHITLSTFWVSVLNADPVNNNLLIVWNRPLPGARDQLLQNLKNVTPDIEGSVLDNDVGGPYRSAPATSLNPLATVEDTVSYSGMSADADVALTIGGPAVSFTLFAPLAVPADARYMDITYNAATTEPTVPSGLESQTAGDFTVDLVANTITGFGAGSAPAGGAVVPVVFNATALAGTPELSGCPGSFTVLITTLPTPGGTFQITVAEANLTSGSYLSAGAMVRFRKR